MPAGEVEAMEQWNMCLTKLRASTRPDAASTETIIRELSALPYPLDFGRDTDAIGNLLCDLCRLARLDSKVSLVAVSELATLLTTKHAVAISEGSMQTIVTFLCAAIEGEPDDVRQRGELLRALSAILYGNGQRCANLMDGLLRILLPLVTDPATSPAAATDGAAGWQEQIELQRLTLDCLGSLFSQTGMPAADGRSVGVAGMGGGGGSGSHLHPLQSPGRGGGRGGQRGRGGGGRGYGRGRGRSDDFDIPMSRAEGRVAEARGRVFMLTNRSLQAYANGYGDDAGLSKLLCSALRCVYICIGGDEALLQPHDLRQVVGLAHSLLGDPTDALAARRRAPAGGGRPVLQLSSKRGGTGGAGSRDWSNTRTRAPGEKASGGSSGRDWAAARSEQTPTKTKPSGSPDEESGGSGGEGYSSGGGGRGGGGRRTAEALSRVRYHALLLLQAVARCGSLRNQMYEHWKSLLPSTVAEAVALKPYTTTVATVLLHDPSPTTRRTASSTLHAMLDGSKRYLASAELDRDSTRGGDRSGGGSGGSGSGMARSFASLSHTLSVWVCAFHEVLQASLKKENEPACIASLLKTLAVLLASSPYGRLKSQGLDLLCKIGTTIEAIAKVAAEDLRSPPPRSKRQEAEPVIAACCTCLRNGLVSAGVPTSQAPSGTAMAFMRSLSDAAQPAAAAGKPQVTSVLLEEMMAACAEPDRPLFVVTEALLALVAFGRHCRAEFTSRWSNISPALRHCISHPQEDVRAYTARCIEEHTRPLIVEGEGDVESDANRQRISNEQSEIGKGPEMAFWSELLSTHIKVAIRDKASVVNVAGVGCLANIPAHIYGGLSVDVREWVFGNIRKAVAAGQHTVREEGWRALGWLCRHPAARADAAFVDQSGRLLVTAMRQEQTSRVRIRCVWCVANLCGALAEQGEATADEPLDAEADLAAAVAAAAAEPEDDDDVATTTVSFGGEGKLGIVFEKDMTPLVIKRVTPNTLAAERPELRPGLVLVDVGYPAPWAGAPITKASYKEAIQRLKEATRPITFVFADKAPKEKKVEVSGGYGKFAKGQLEAGRRPWLVSLAECSMQSMDEPDKIQANGARALGSLAALLLQPRIVAENQQAAELQPRVVDVLLRGASARSPKVAWNACYALSSLLQVGGRRLSVEAGGRILDTLLQALLFSPNFKVRLSAAVGLTTPETAAGYCGRLGEALATVCEAASQFETNSFGSRRPLIDNEMNFGQTHTRGMPKLGFGRGAGGSEDPRAAASEPTSPLGRFSRPGARVGMVSLSAEEDRANLKHKAALRNKLEETVLHLLRVAVAETEPQPEPEPTAAVPEPEVDTGSPAAKAAAARETRLGKIGNAVAGASDGSPRPPSEGSLTAEVAGMLVPHVPLVSRLLGQEMPPAMDVAAALCAGFHAAAAKETGGAADLWAAAAELEAAVSAVADATSIMDGM